jgi:hypothetical protein
MNLLKVPMFNSPEYMLSEVTIHSKIGSLPFRVIFVPDFPDVFPSLRNSVAQEHEIDVPAFRDLVELRMPSQLPVTRVICP